jgi:ribosome assembly protein 4
MKYVTLLALSARAALQVVFSPDGRWVLSASFDKSVKLWDGVKGTFLATFRGHVGPVYQVMRSAQSHIMHDASVHHTLLPALCLADC